MRPAPTVPGSSKLLERFELLEVLGHGAHGSVTRAFDRTRGMPVALKRLHTSGPDELFELKHEFRVASRLEHPNLVRVYDLIVEGAGAHLSMEVLDGEPLHRALSFGNETRTSPLVDSELERVAWLFGQIAAAVEAVHDHGLMHRDLKPSNVIVDDSGRAVLIDFGLATQLWSRLPDGTPDGKIAGTFPYMSPEHLLGRPIDAASDWYGFGVMLFQALTGRLPFVGRGIRATFEKTRGPGVRADELVPDTDRRLADLAQDLLHPDPGKRPHAGEIRRLLDECVNPTKGTASEAPARRSEPSARREPPLFVGRDAELARLRHDWTRAASTTVISALVGQSGFGKTALLERFGAEIEAAGHPVLRSTCHEREDVPFGAADGWVDDLTRYLMQQPSIIDAIDEADWFHALLAFPVLGRARTYGLQPVPMGESEPVRGRGRAFAGVRSVMSALAAAAGAPLIVVEDVQWGDLDSVALLRALLRPPAVVRMVLISARSDDADSETARAFLSLSNSEELVLPALSERALEALAVSKLGEADADRAGDLARAAAGSPLFVEMLVRAYTEGALGDAPPDLSRLICARARLLPKGAQEVMHVVSMASRPLAISSLRAMSSQPDEIATAVSRLAVGHWIRPVVDTDKTSYVPYHARIADALLAQLGERGRSELRIRIASITARPRAEGASPGSSLDGLAGEGRERMIRAADEALDGLAFHRAAELYQAALEEPEEGDALPRASVLQRLGEAYIACGLGAAGAGALLQAAELEAAGSSAQLRLRRRAAEHYLRAGERERGIDVLRDLLRASGIPWPSSTASTLGRLALETLRLPLSRARSPVDEEALETLWSAGLGLSLFDPMRAAFFQARHGRMAARAQNPSHHSRALSAEGILLAMRGGRSTARAVERLTSARELAGSEPQASLHAKVMWVGYQFLIREDRSVVQQTEQLGELLRAHRGAHWEWANLAWFRLASLSRLGELARLGVELEEMLARAGERGDAYAGSLLPLGHPMLAWLATDRPERVLAETDEALNEGVLGPYLRHFARMARARALLYQGNDTDALQLLRDAESELRRSAIWWFEHVRREHLAHLGRAALAGSGRTTGGDRRRLHKLVRRCVRGLSERPSAWTEAQAASLTGGLALHDGRPEAAVDELRRAAARFESLEMDAEGAVAMMTAARIERADTGPWERALEQLGVQRPEPFAHAVGVIGAVSS